MEHHINAEHGEKHKVFRMDSKTTKSNTSMYHPLRSKLHHIDRQDLLSLVNSLLYYNKSDTTKYIQTNSNKNNGDIIESDD